MLIKLKDTHTIGMVMDFMSANDLNYEIVKEETNKLQLKVKGVEMSCGGCPTIFDFVNILNNHILYFRLRSGSWTLVDETDSKLLLSGTACSLGLDGCCTWEQAIQLIAEEGLDIIDMD